MARGGRLVAAVLMRGFLLVISLLVTPLAFAAVPNLCKGRCCFYYSPRDIRRLGCMQSQYVMETEDLRRWDQIAREAIDKNHLTYLEALRIYTYLYVAQAEAASLSCRAKQLFLGSLDPVSNGVLKLLVSNYEQPSDYREDRYSRALADLVLSRVEWRLYREDQKRQKFSVPARNRTVYVEGLSLAKRIPWCISDVAGSGAPNPPPPGDPEWKHQCELIKEAQEPKTAEKEAVVNYWAGITGPGVAAWHAVTNRYLWEQDVGLAKALQVRAVLFISLYDGTIVCFHCKYRYQCLRPSAYDSTVTPWIAVPGHPSYPSDHSVESAIAASILTHFFPCEWKRWQEMVDDACESRIWAGVHYPLDDRAGRRCGERVACIILGAMQS
jgi:hypothetical protein